MIELVARWLEAPLAVRDAELAPRDAIVVLGARLGPDGELTPILDERVVAAAALFHAGAGPRVVVTGGITRTARGPWAASSRPAARTPARGRARRAEADALADGLVAAGVPADAIVIERRAQTTAENARFTAALLAPFGARTLWLDTQPFHGRRAARLFARAGFDPLVWHIADSVQYRDRPRAVRWLVREYAAWAKHLLRRDG